MLTIWLEDCLTDVVETLVRVVLRLAWSLERSAAAAAHPRGCPP